MLHHFHITEASKEEVRYQTLINAINSKRFYTKSAEESDADPNPVSLYSNALVYYDLGYTVRAGVHFFLYLKAIKLLGTEKHQELLMRAFNMKDMGCFGLTELTHGSNVKGILTEAHYDHKTKEFVMHSPSK
jgi:acyl-CoA oxidase